MEAAVSINTTHKLTPMMEQYRSIKRSLPSDTILFFRLGDFYEMFFEDAVNASEILNITLTGREAGKAGRVPMCGIPYHAFQGYVGTLVDSNLKVAICEQVGDPKAKGLVEREVTRVISPATYLEGEGPERRFAYMVALAQDKDRYGLAFLELSTGEFAVREVPEERLTGELTLLSPREVILPESVASDEALLNFIKNGLKATVTRYEDWVFEADEGMRLMQEIFDLASPQSLPCYDRPLAVRSAGAVLYYLRDHHHASLGHLQLPTLLETKEYMVLDRQTQQSLELVMSLSGDKEGPTLLKTIDKTLTSMGGRTLHRWITHPLLTLSEIKKRQEVLTELIADQTQLEGMRSLLRGVRDMERALSRLNYGVANARDLKNLKLFLARVPELQSFIGAQKSSLMQELVQSVVPQPELHDLIERAIVEEPPLAIKEGGVIRDGYDDGLDELRSISTKGKSWLLEFEKRESIRTGIKKLKIKYSGVFGYTIEVSKANLQNIPDNYVRRQTLANAERFVTPELKEWDEKISGAQDKIKALEYDLFNDVRKKVLEQLRPLQAMARGIGELDALCSLAITAAHKGWVCPEVDSTRVLAIEGGRHPVVENMLPAGDFVENDVLLNETDQQLVILTGPNMAGKSTYIRQVAQLVILAQLGSFIPANTARIGIVDRIFTRIGASDDLARGESTFMVEMVEMAHILHKATEKSLLILDEVGRGTSTFDGVSIAWAICEHLAKESGRPRSLFATHYHELTQLEEHFPGIKNYHITVKETANNIVFLRKVVRGGADRSYGIHVAQLAGIPRPVTQRAREILQILENENTEATQIIEGQKTKEKREVTNQATLFDWAPVESPVVEELRKLDINSLTPLEALNQLAKLKEGLDG